MAQLTTILSKVTLFQRQALLTRSGTLALPAGKASLIVSDLPISIDPATFQAKVLADSPAKMLGMQYHQTFSTNSRDAETKSLQKEIEDLTLRIETQNQKMDSLNGQIVHLDALLEETRSLSYALNNQRTSIEAHFVDLEKINSRRDALQLAQAGHRTAVTELQKEVVVRELELQRVQSNADTQAWELQIELELAEAGTAVVEISYLQKDCSWQPQYAAYLVSDKLTIDYIAQISQQSGEDWLDVSLSLSTARPRSYAELPEPRAWFIQKHEPKPLIPPQAKMTRMSAANDMPDGVSMGARPPMFAEMEAMTVEEQGTHMSFTLPHPICVVSQTAATSITIATLELPHSDERVVYPRLGPDVYRRIELDNTSAYALLPGKVRLFADGGYLGESLFPIIPVGGKYKMNFGADERVKVERKLMKQDINKKILQDRQLSQYGYQISINNASSEKLTIEVHDQIPLSRNEEMKVRLDFAEPKDYVMDDLHRLQWVLVLEPKSERSIHYQFVVDAPKDIIISGLPLS